MTPIRVIVIDDHSLFRRGLISLLDDMAEIQVVGEGQDGRDAIRSVRKYNPDMVLMDVNMPEMDGVEAVTALRAQNYPGRILMLTISQNEADLIGALKAGADGYLLKNLEPEELHRAILQVDEGMGALAPEVTRTVLSSLQGEPDPTDSAGLTPRELEVLRLIAQGATTTQVASSLTISEATVKTHVKHILEKLDAANRVEAIHRANQLGLIS